MSAMKRTERDLKFLMRWLRKHGPPMPHALIMHDKEDDRENESDHRHFARVVESGIIHAAWNMEELLRPWRIGVLLHEVGHIYLPKATEAEVDAWILATFPQAGYCYKDCEYWMSRSGPVVVAKNVECVSDAFVRAMANA